MNILLQQRRAELFDTDVLIFGVHENRKGLPEEMQRIDEMLTNQISECIGNGEITGRVGELTLLHTFQRVPAKKIIIAGLGKTETTTLTRLASVSADAIRLAQKVKARTVGVSIRTMNIDQHFSLKDCAQALTEGFLLGSYRFQSYKTQDKDSLQPIQSLNILESEGRITTDIEQGIMEGQILADAVNFTRDLVNHPSNVLTPEKLALIAKNVAMENRLDIQVLAEEDMYRQGMQALLAVARGSCFRPQLIVLRYQGNPGGNTIAMIGKGITFDSGGISLKPGAGMGDMKDDMAGGAAVLGAMQAIARLKPKVNVLAVIPAAENMPDGQAYKPGDIVTSMAGKTVEIISTDAEGRLLLIDALTFAIQQGAVKLLDIATLTGACEVALGSIYSGVISNNRTWCEEVLESSRQSGEKMWELPHDTEYKELIKSSIADLKNSGGRYAGAITAGLFLEEFTQKLPWVHIDIAGTALSNKEQGCQVKGATGVGVKTLVTLCRRAGAKT